MSSFPSSHSRHLPTDSRWNFSIESSVRSRLAPSPNIYLSPFVVFPFDILISFSISLLREEYFHFSSKFGPLFAFGMCCESFPVFSRKSIPLFFPPAEFRCPEGNEQPHLPADDSSSLFMRQVRPVFSVPFTLPIYHRLALLLTQSLLFRRSYIALPVKIGILLRFFILLYFTSFTFDFFFSPEISGRRDRFPICLTSLPLIFFPVVPARRRLQLSPFLFFLRKRALRSREERRCYRVFLPSRSEFLPLHWSISHFSFLFTKPFPLRVSCPLFPLRGLCRRPPTFASPAL